MKRIRRLLIVSLCAFSSVSTAVDELREDNITDVEVTEILSAAREFLPGDTVYISAIYNGGCDCHDGPQCT